MICCKTCGCLKENLDNPSPEGSGIEWYSQENIDRLWAEARNSGDFLICHSTDPNAPDYGGKQNIKKGKETACLGITLWIYMHITVFGAQANCKYPKYRKLVGKEVSMDQQAMAKAALNMHMSTTGLSKNGPFRGLLIPTSIQEEREIIYPTGFKKVRELFEEVQKQRAHASKEV